VQTFLRGCPEILHVETDSRDHVPQALALLARREVDILAVNGGDGTLQHVLTEILGNHALPRLPLIAPLRGGRTNMNAVDIGSHRDPVAALSVLTTAARNGALSERIVERPVLRVDVDPGQHPQYGLFFGGGVFQRTIALKHQILPKRHFQGLVGSAVFAGALLTRATLGSVNGLLTPDHLEIHLDDQSVEKGKFLVVMATSLDRILFNLFPFWGQESAPIHFTAIAPGVPRSLPAILRVLRGRPPFPGMPTPGYLSHNVRQVELHLDCGFLVDGELFPPVPGRVVRIGTDQRLRFVRSN
jgi:diacylglycerol kinase family enzyme